MDQSIPCTSDSSNAYNIFHNTLRYRIARNVPKPYLTALELKISFPQWPRLLNTSAISTVNKGFHLRVRITDQDNQVIGYGYPLKDTQFGVDPQAMR